MDHPLFSYQETSDGGSIESKVVLARQPESEDEWNIIFSKPSPF